MKKQDRVCQEVFGIMPDGKIVKKFTMKNSFGMEVQVITYGGSITGISVPDMQGIPGDVVLGFDDLETYLRHDAFFGAVVGRYANRIGEGKLVLDGRLYQLPLNLPPNHLHGGNKGFGRVVWEAEIVKDSKDPSIELYYHSKDLEEGYPGNLQVRTRYTLTDDNALLMETSATTDKKTVVNITYHPYFNLSGHADQPILEQELTIFGSSVLETDAGMIPTGKLRSVQNTPFDFRKPKRIGLEITADDLALKQGNGYDHCYALDGPEDSYRLAAIAYDPESGRSMELFTDMPGLQLYTANWLDHQWPAKGGQVTYGPRTAFCLEPQYFPDAPNRPEFRSPVLEPGKEYYSRTVLRFNIK